MTEHEKSLLEDKIRKLASTKTDLVWVRGLINRSIKEIEMFQFEIREILDAHSGGGE